jgi:NADH:ubiquinone reductase (H+-translocating)
VGAGLGGLAAAAAFRGSGVRVTVVDSHNYSAFPPLLFQAAVGVISPEDVVRPVRGVLGRWSNVTFRLGDVTAVDWQRRRVRLADGDALPYDDLILAPGVVASSWLVPGAQEHAVPLKSVTDASRLRNSVLRAFEDAAAHRDRRQPPATSVAIIGGGATGVELAGYLADILFRSFASDYPQIDRSQMRLAVVELGDRLLPGFHPKLSRYAQEMLRRRSVDIRLDTSVTGVDSGGITLDTGEKIPAATVVWAGGVAAPAWLRSCVTLEHGRVVVEPDLRLADHPDTFVIGDAAAVRSSSGGLYPQVAQVAIQGGRHAARQIQDLAAGRPTRPFRYWDKGSMAVIGCNAAVLQTGRFRLTGRAAWFAWGLLHIAYLRGMPNRLSVAQKWRWWHLTHEATTRVLVEEPVAIADLDTRRSPTAVRTHHQ